MIVSQAHTSFMFRSLVIANRLLSHDTRGFLADGPAFMFAETIPFTATGTAGYVGLPVHSEP
jgi:hypothetical protein